MTFRFDDEKDLLEEFIEWLIKDGWLAAFEVIEQKQLVEEFLKARKIE